MQDPVARTVSSHNMVQSVLQQEQYCTKNDAGETVCRPKQPLLEMARAGRDLDFEWPEDISGCNFNSTVRRPKPATAGVNLSQRKFDI